MSGPDNNFLPNIKCPHCGASLVTSLSGFGSELNIRKKECSKCGKPYFLQAYVTTSLYKSIEDGQINHFKHRIKWLKKQRKKALAELLIEYEFAKKINNEALEMAHEMHRKRLMN